MKKLFAVAGLLFSLSLARAHQSAVPHSHSFDSHHSDLFVVSVVALTVLAAGCCLYGAWRRRKRLSAERVRRS
jgi:hypothetical protein